MLQSYQKPSSFSTGNRAALYWPNGERKPVISLAPGAHGGAGENVGAALDLRPPPGGVEVHAAGPPAPCRWLTVWLASSNPAAPAAFQAAAARASRTPRCCRTSPWGRSRRGWRPCRCRAGSSAPTASPPPSRPPRRRGCRRSPGHEHRGLVDAQAAGRLLRRGDVVVAGPGAQAGRRRPRRCRPSGRVADASTASAGPVRGGVPVPRRPGHRVGDRWAMSGSRGIGCRRARPGRHRRETGPDPCRRPGCHLAASGRHQRAHGGSQDTERAGGKTSTHETHDIAGEPPGDLSHGCFMFGAGGGGVAA